MSTGLSKRGCCIGILQWLHSPMLASPFRPAKCKVCLWSQMAAFTLIASDLLAGMFSNSSGFGSMRSPRQLRSRSRKSVLLHNHRWHFIRDNATSHQSAFMSYALCSPFQQV